jgi:hypothetical protein
VEREHQEPRRPLSDAVLALPLPPFLLTAIPALVATVALVALLAVAMSRADIPETRSGHQKQPPPVRVEEPVPPLKKR